MDKNFIIKADEVLKTVQSGEKITAALSGGADSVFLLYLLIDYCSEKGIFLEAVHVNHCLRGAESDRDEQFCRELCEKKHIPLILKKIDVKDFCEKNHLSTEEGARNLRYKIFDSLDGFVATAHNLSDCAETVIFNMARGTALKGLCSIPKTRGKIIRPLLKISGREIRDYLTSHGISFVTDSTNLSDDYTRNKIRHNILPVLEKINENYLSNIGKMIDSLCEDNDFLESEAQKLSGDITELKNVHGALRKRFIKNMISKSGAGISFDRINRAETVIFKGNREQLEGNIFAYIENGRLVVGETTYPCDFSVARSPLLIGENKFSDEKVIILEKVNFQEINNINNFLTNFIIDYDKIQGGLYFRTPVCGDKIQLKGENFHRKLRKIFNAKKIPLSERSSAVIIETSEEIIFSEYCGISDGISSYDQSGNLYKITIKKL